MTSVLAHVHALNDEKVIAKSVAAILKQTRPVDDFLIVDDGSTDGTLNVKFPPNTTLIQHSRNLGTSGTVRTGIQHALEHGYDWLWVFDADASPRPDALEKLLDYYESLGADERSRIHRLASLSINMSTGRQVPGFDMGPRGFGPATPAPNHQPYGCIGTIWSGSLFRMDSIRTVGLPALDYVLDWGEVVYGYQAAVKGFRTVVVPASVIDHNIDIDGPSANAQVVHIGPIKFTICTLAPRRFYYFARNDVFFWTHEFRERSVHRLLRLLPGWSWIPKLVVKFTLLQRWAEIHAILRGVVDGLLGRMKERY